MKGLIIYYSRTGNTKIVAKKLAELLGWELEEIRDTQSRLGVIGFLRSGFQAYRKKLTRIENPYHDPAEYELILIGTPVWAGTISVPVRTYITQYKDKFNQVAFFSTNGDKEQIVLFKEMEALCGKNPVSTLSIPAKKVKDEEYMVLLKKFIADLK